MKKYAIKGVTGFIGKALAQRLLAAEDCEVVGIGRSSESLKSIGILNERFTAVSRDDEKRINMLNNTDIFFDASWSGYGKYTNNFDVQFSNVYEINLTLEEIKDIKCKRFVFFNSSAVYQKSLISNDYDSVYGAAKNAADRLARIKCAQSKIEYISLIFPHIYGVGDFSRRSASSIIFSMMNNISPKLISEDGLYDWVYIDDTVDGILAAGEKGISGREYYVGHRAPRRFGEIVTEVGNIISPKLELRFGEYNSTSFVDFAAIDMNALYNDTGFECKADFKESILKTAEWVKSLNWEV